MSTEAKIVHPVHAAVAKIQRAWSDSDVQASIRASQIVVVLARLGMLKDVGDIGVDYVYLKHSDES